MKLEILLAFVALMLFSLGGEANILVQKSALLHGSVTMSYSPLLKMGTIQSITWRFDKNNKRTLILDTTRKPHFIYDSQFKDRLQISDNLFTLTIMDLTMEDSGVYNIDCTDTTGKVDSSTFNVTVYEPIPNPIIRTHFKVRTTDGCNVTLHCSVPSNTSDLSYTWKYRLQGSEYQPYNNGSTVQISPDHQDMEFLCIVQNPADQKNVSTQVQKICMPTATSGIRSYISTIMVFLISLIILLLGVSVYCFWKKYRKTKEPKETPNEELNYIEVTTHPREANQVGNENYIGLPSPQKTKAETVYTMLQHPRAKNT